MAGMITGPAASWLAARREELNQRFLAARRAHPRLEPAAALAALEAILPPLAEGDADAPLLSAVYDLVLLHVGRDALAAQPGLSALLREAFPPLRRLLAEEPRFLPAALSNAVERLGPDGEAFARRLPEVGRWLGAGRELAGAGVVIAWTLGEARLREAALEAAAALPARAALAALGVPSWPAAAAPLAVAALRADGWRRPEAAVSPQTLRRLEEGEPVEPIVSRLAALRPAEAPLASWEPLSRAGDFTGFGGPFEVPPVVLDGGDRHRFHLRAGDAFFRLDADCFGWRCEPEADPGLAVRKAGGTMRRAAARLVGAGKLSGGAVLQADGTLTRGREQVKLAALAGAGACVLLPDLVAVTRPDSHRLRLAGPRGAPL